MKRSTIDMLDTAQLRIVDALYTTRSVTHAAAALGVGQPTVSITLGKLRHYFADPLFVRTPSGMQASQRTEEIIEDVRDALRLLQRLSSRNDAFDPLTNEQTFRICMTDASHITLLPRLLSKVRAAAPRVRLEAAQIDGTLRDALRSGSADLAIGFIPDLVAGFYAQTLYEQRWVCLTHARHPRIGRRGLSLERYKAEAHIEIISGTGYKLLEMALRKNRIQRNVALKLPGFLGLSGILRATDLVATLPRHTANTLAGMGELAVHDCPFPIQKFLVKQYWHARQHKDSANLWLRQICKDLFQNVTASAPKAT